MQVKLADPAQQLPWPDQPRRILTGPEPFVIDPTVGFWRACLADGSIVAVTAPTPAVAHSRSSRSE